MENRTHTDVKNFLIKKRRWLEDKVEFWMEKYEADTESKSQELVQLKADKERDLKVLQELARTYDDYEVIECLNVSIFQTWKNLASCTRRSCWKTKNSRRKRKKRARTSDVYKNTGMKLYSHALIINISVSTLFITVTVTRPGGVVQWSVAVSASSNKSQRRKKGKEKAKKERGKAKRAKNKCLFCTLYKYTTVQPSNTSC